jgi:hypothetical protein
MEIKRIFRASQEEMSIFWEVVVLTILSKKVYLYMCPIPSGFRDRAISLHCSTVVSHEALRRATRRVLTRAAQCIDVDGGIFENVLY